VPEPGGRDAVLRWVADRVEERQLGHPVRVGIDGVCGAGKTMFADALADVIRADGRPVVRLDSDGFHHVREIRYRQGRESARGYYEDAYDFDALADRVLRTLGPGGDLTYPTAVHDLASDAVVSGAPEVADPRAVLLFDCTFLQRGALRQLWDEVVYLDVPLPVARARGVARDSDALGGPETAGAAYDDRYLAACTIYLVEEDPVARADVVIRNDDPAHPVLVRSR
jgi:uridine kinase